MYQTIKEAVNTFVTKNAREPQVLALHYEDYCDFRNDFIRNNGFCKNRSMILESDKGVRIGGVLHFEIYVVRTTDIPKNTFKLL